MDNFLIEDKIGEPELLGLESSPDVDSSTLLKKVPKSSTKVSKDMRNIFSPSLSRRNINKPSTVSKANKNEVDLDIDDVYIDMGRKGTPVDNEVRKITNMNELMEKSVIVPGFDRLHTVPSYEVGQYTQRKERKVSSTQ